MNKHLQQTAIFLILSFITTAVFAQNGWLYNGTNAVTLNPAAANVGVGITPTERFHIYGGALKIGNSTSPADRAVNMIKIGDGDYVQIGEWEADDMLSFKARNYNFTNGPVGIGLTNGTTPSQKLHVEGNSYFNGNIGIGKAPSTIKLDVNGTIAATQSIITHNATADWGYAVRALVNRDYTKAFAVWNNATSTETFVVYGNGIMEARYIKAGLIEVLPGRWPDFVFANDYKLRPLQEVEQFIKANKHLPGIPSAAEVGENGYNMGEMQEKLLMKIEELTLYIIQQQEMIQTLNVKVEKLENQGGF
ncbi:MAG: hypothetical protein FWC39_13050 [Bacteroidetes bacterium]|nr:hypothetical protein [Bacteroidota bacterium]